MPLPANANVVVVKGYWWTDQGTGVERSITATPSVDHVTSISGHGPIDLGPKTVTPDEDDPYWEMPLVASNDPDLSSTFAWTFTFSGYDGEWTITVPHDAATDELSRQSVWLTDLNYLVAPPKPTESFYTKAQLDAMFAILDDELEDADIAPDATLILKGRAKLLGGTADAPTVPWNKVTGAPTSFPPSGGAGGVLSGTYPNPGFANDMAYQSELDAHTSRTDNPHGVTKSQVGLANVDNTHDADKPISTAEQTALNGKANTTHVHGAADLTSGVLAIGRIPTGTTGVTVPLGNDSRLSDSRSWTLYAGGSPTVGQTLSWNGSGYAPVAASGAPDASPTVKGLVQLTGDLGGTAGAPTVPGLATHVARTDNPHSTTKAQVGLGSVDNTSDLAKPISTAAQTALNTKSTLLTSVSKNAAYTAVANDYVLASLTTAWTLTLPAAPPDKTRIGWKNVAQTGTNALTVACGGSDHFNTSSGPTTGSFPLLNQAAIAQYDATTATWVVQSSDLALSQLDLRFAAILHASAHATGGSDAISPTSIGAVPATQRGPIGGVTDLGSVASGATVTPDASVASQFTITAAAGGFTLAAPTNPTTGQHAVVTVAATGAARTVTLQATILLVAGLTASYTITSGKTAYFLLRRDSDAWVCLAQSQRA